MSSGDLVSGEIKPDAPVGLFERQSMFGPWIEVGRPTDKSVPLYDRPAAMGDLVSIAKRLVESGLSSSLVADARAALAKAGANN